MPCFAGMSVHSKLCTRDLPSNPPRVVESCIAIVAGSVPALYAFWKTFIAPSALYTKARSCLSSIAKHLPTRAKSTLRSSQSGPKLPLTRGDSQEQIYVYDGRQPAFYKVDVHSKNGRGGISQCHIR